MDWLASFRGRYPGFDSVPNSTVSLYLDDAKLFLDEGVWGTFYTLGIMTLTCHELMLNGMGDTLGGVAGNITSRSDGDISVSFKAKMVYSAADEYYTQTPCGERYLDMRNRAGMGIFTVPVS